MGAGRHPVILVIGVGLPIAAWRVSRRLESRRQPAGGLGPSADVVDKWLIEQHPLPAVQRWQVRDAVLHGRAVLRPFGRRRATWPRALRGELKMGRGIRIASYVMLVEGAAMIAVGMFARVSPGSPAGMAPVLLGAWWLVKAVVALRMIQRGARRACQLNA